MDSLPFIEHLRPKHGINRVLIVSGETARIRRQYRCQMLWDYRSLLPGKNPEEKVDIVVEETKKGKTVYLGDRDK